MKALHATNDITVFPKDANPLISVLLDAVNKNVNVETVEKLMGLYERQNSLESRKAFSQAMAEAKAEMPKIVKNKKVDFSSKGGRTRYSYENLENILNNIEPVLSKYGLSVRFKTFNDPGKPISVTCILEHRDGHSEENTLVAPRDESGTKNVLQSIGSTVTYLQRYTLKAALGVAAAEDDDGAGGVIYLSPEESYILEELIEKTKSDKSSFCRYLNVRSLSELPQNKFLAAKDALEAKEKKLLKGANDESAGRK